MTITIGGRRYRWAGLRRRRESVASMGPHCPYCGGDNLHGAGETVVGPRVTRKPVVCRECGAEAVLWWRTSPAMRDMYYAQRAGVSVRTFRQYRDAALQLHRREKGPRGA